MINGEASHLSFRKTDDSLPGKTIVAVCIYRFVITFGLRSKYDVLGHYFIFMIVLPSINKFNMT